MNSYSVVVDYKKECLSGAEERTPTAAADCCFRFADAWGSGGD
jgi:hypothetical protein